MSRSCNKTNFIQGFKNRSYLTQCCMTYTKAMLAEQMDAIQCMINIIHQYISWQSNKYCYQVVNHSWPGTLFAAFIRDALAFFLPPCTEFSWKTRTPLSITNMRICSQTMSHAMKPLRNKHCFLKKRTIGAKSAV